MQLSIRVLVADDTPISRVGLRGLLSLIPEVVEVSEAESPLETIQLAEQWRPDVVLLDLSWDDDESAGAALIPQIKAIDPHIRVLAHTAYPGLIAQARRAGADLALSKRSVESHAFLAKRLKEIMVVKLPPPLTSQQEPDSAHIEPLTPREVEVLTCLAQTLPVKAIANRLHIAHGTASKHVNRIYAKLGVNNRLAAVDAARRRGGP